MAEGGCKILTTNDQLKQLQLIKAEGYKILKRNQTVLWQHCCLAIIKHLQAQFQKTTVPVTHFSQWIPAKVQSIVKWMGDVAAKERAEKMREKQEYWIKQRKEWENTFQQLLIQQTNTRKTHQCQLLDKNYEIEQLRKKNSDLHAKYSAMESQKRVVTHLFNQYSQNLIKAQLFVNKPVTEQKQTQYQMLSQSPHSLYPLQKHMQIKETELNQFKTCKSEQYEFVGNLQRIQTVGQFNVDQGRKRSFSVSYESILQLSKQIQMSISGIEGISNFRYGNQKYVHNIGGYCDRQGQNKVKMLTIATQYQQIKENGRESINKQVQTQQNDEQQQEQECESSQSQIQVWDKATQTVKLKQATAQVQTEPTVQQKQNLTLLKRIAYLQQRNERIQKQMEEIDGEKLKKMREYEQILRGYKKKVHQLEQDVKISSNMQSSLFNQLMEYKKNQQEFGIQYHQVCQEFKQYLGQIVVDIGVSKVVDIGVSKVADTGLTKVVDIGVMVQQDDSICARCQQLQNYIYNLQQEVNKNQQAQTQLSEKSEQLMTTQSEDDLIQSHPHLIDKQVVGRYLVDFLKLEASGGSVDKKVAAIATLVQVLGLCDKHHSLVIEYGKRMKYHNNGMQYHNNGMKKIYNKQEKQLADKLYSYLTQE